MVGGAEWVPPCPEYFFVDDDAEDPFFARVIAVLGKQHEGIDNSGDDPGCPRAAVKTQEGSRPGERGPIDRREPRSDRREAKSALRMRSGSQRHVTAVEAPDLALGRLEQQGAAATPPVVTSSRHRVEVRAESPWPRCPAAGARRSL